MAKRKKRAKAQRRLAKVRGKARKGSKSARGKVKKRTIARAKVKQTSAKKEQGTPAVETVIVDVIEEPVPGVITVTEFEETEVRERIQGRDESKK